MSGRDPKRIGLFGGSFDPPHVAHLILAETAREQADLEEIWWIPAAIPPHKQRVRLTDPVDRIEMIRRAIAGNRHFRINDLEIRRSGVSYTIQTITELQGEYPTERFFLLVGGDSLRDFHTWYRPEEILARVDLIVYDRPGYDFSGVSQSILKKTIELKAPLLEISGTDIRQRVEDGKSIRYRVPESVRSYIVNNKLYQSNDE